MVWSVEAMKALRVVITTLALVKPPRPVGRTQLMVNGFKLVASFSWYLYLEGGEDSRTALK